MAEIVVNGTYTVNVLALSERLKENYPGVEGISVLGNNIDANKFNITQLTIHLAEDISPQVRDALLAEVASHNPDSLTLQQQDIIDRNEAKLTLAGSQVDQALTAIETDMTNLPTADITALRTILNRVLLRQFKLVQIVGILIEEELEGTINE